MTPDSSARSAELFILIVDDNMDDVVLMEEAVAAIPEASVYGIANNGSEAAVRVEEAVREGKRAPDVIFMDINMPRMNGLEASKSIRMLAGYQTLPIVIMTTSDRNEDIWGAYDSGANIFIKKPDSFLDLKEVTASLVGFFQATRIRSNAPSIVAGN